MRTQNARPAARQPPRDSDEERIIPVRQLVGSNGRIRLEHHGKIYLLRITRNDKLILTR